MFLLDTDIIVELRKPRPQASVLAWFEALRPEEVALPAQAIGEIGVAIELLKPRDPKRAAELTAWLDSLDHSFPVLPASAAVLRVWAQLMQKRPRPLASDAIVAATALHHGLTVATRQTATFAAFGVLVANPFGRAR